MGEPRKYYAKPHYDQWIYICPIGGCAHPTLNSPEIEDKAKEFTRNLLEAPTNQFYKSIDSLQNKHEIEQDLKKELNDLEHKNKELTNDEAQLLLDRSEYGVRISVEAFDQALSVIQTRRRYIEERTETINEQLNRQSEAITTLKEIQANIVGGLDELSYEQWRELFTALNLEIHVRDGVDRKTWPREWLGEGVENLWGDWWVAIGFGIALVPTEKVGEIVINTPMYVQP
ncbi:hypothetical protein ACFLXK_03795 [Chloroflexota bacterium]